MFPAALADPLLARLLLWIERDFLPGHVPRPFPSGYLASPRGGENLIDDQSLARYHERVLTLARGPLLSRERWENILRLNFTSERVYSEAYIQAEPPYPIRFARRHGSLVDYLRRLDP